MDATRLHFTPTKPSCSSSCQLGFSTILFLALANQKVGQISIQRIWNSRNWVGRTIVPAESSTTPRHVFQNTPIRTPSPMTNCLMLLATTVGIVWTRMDDTNDATYPQHSTSAHDLVHRLDRCVSGPRYISGDQKVLYILHFHCMKHSRSYPRARPMLLCFGTSISRRDVICMV